MGLVARVRSFIHGVVFHTVDREKLLRRGLRLGQRVYIGPDVIIDAYHCWLISIGDDCKFAPRVHILAHDASMHNYLGYTKIGRVVIGDRTCVGAGTIILPGVTIGSDVLIGAGSVVAKDIPDGVVAAGNPLTILCTTEDYIARHRARMQHRPLYPEKGYTIRGGISPEAKELMWQALQDGTGYVA